MTRSTNCDRARRAVRAPGVGVLFGVCLPVAAFAAKTDWISGERPIKLCRPEGR